MIQCTPRSYVVRSLKTERSRRLSNGSVPAVGSRLGEDAGAIRENHRFGFASARFLQTHQTMEIWKLGMGLLLVPVMLTGRPFTVVAYNVENLHDADGVAVYDDYQPSIYTHAHALTKVNNIASVLARFNAGQGPDIALLQEIEIDQTPGKTPPDYAEILKRYAGTTIDRMLGADFTPEIADLPAEALLLKACVDHGLTGYSVVTGGDQPGKHEDGHGHAIKTVVFTKFPVKAVHVYPTLNARNILEVELDVDGYPLTVFDNHWKSGAGDPKTEEFRVENARTLKRRVDELLKADPNADLIIGGDLNSHYNQKRRYRAMKQTGINDILGSQGNELAVRGPAKDLYNLWFELPPEDRGSDTFRGQWGTLMNLIISRGLYDMRGVQYADNSFGVARFPGLNADSSGRPVRWNEKKPAGAGFSDHFPIYARFTTVADNQPGKFMPLHRVAGVDDDSSAGSNADFKTTAITGDKIPAGADLRDGTWSGKLFFVEGKAVENRYSKVSAFGDVYDVYSPDKGIRDALAAQKAGGKYKFYGELGQYKNRWQFVVQSMEWVK